MTRSRKTLRVIFDGSIYTVIVIFVLILIFILIFRSVYKELHTNHGTGLLTTNKG